VTAANVRLEAIAFAESAHAASLSSLAKPDVIESGPRRDAPGFTHAYWNHGALVAQPQANGSSPIE
jgi:hypothetical protein